MEIFKNHAEIYGAAAEYKSHLPDKRLCFQNNRKTQASFKCISCRHQGNTDVVNIKERGRSSLARGQPEKKAQAQVNLGRSKRPTPNQQQESTEVISSASC